MAPHLDRRHGSLALLLAALAVITGCFAPIPTTSEPSASIRASATQHPSEPATPSPVPSRPPTVSWEAAQVPSSMIASATLQIVPGGDGLVAIGFDGGFGSMLWTSADGRSWTDVTPNGFEALGIVSTVPFAGGLLGVGRADTTSVDTELAAIHRSEDGVTWREVEVGDEIPGQLIDVVATDAGLYAVGGVPGADTAGIWRSADGDSWERAGGEFEHAFLWAIAEGDGTLVAVGWRRNPEPDLAVWTSPNGVDWTLSPDPEGFEGFEGTDLVNHDGTLVMVGGRLTGGEGRMWYSGDAGITWETADVAGGLEGAAARSLTRTPAGLVAVGSRDMDAAAWISADGRSWEPLGEPVPNAYFNSGFVTEGGALIVTGATQEGTQELGIEAHAAIWIAALD